MERMYSRVWAKFLTFLRIFTHQTPYFLLDAFDGAKPLFLNELMHEPRSVSTLGPSVALKT